MSINAIVHTFEGTALQTLEWDGRPCWVARHMGQHLGYSEDGGRLAKKILSSWASEMVEGKDYAFLAGRELEAFKVASAEVGPAGYHLAGNGGGRLLVLFESGAHLALLKTNKPMGARLRRFLADEVLPQLVRTGTYSPAAPADTALVARVETLERQGEERFGRIETALASLTEAITALVRQQAQPRGRGGVTVNAPGAQITLVEPTPPEGFTVPGLKVLAASEGCSHPKLKKRLEAVGLWDDPHWVWVGERSIPRSGRLDTETFYRFRQGILGELHRRERGPMFGGGEA